METYILEDNYNNKKKSITYSINESGCYICVSHAKNRNGYYKIKRYSKSIDLHVWIYKVFNGRIEDKNIVRHTCNNRGCINPKHLITGTYRDNYNDMVKSGISKNKLNINDVKQIKWYLKNTDLKHYEIAEIFSINVDRVSKISSGLTWKNVEI